MAQFTKADFLTVFDNLFASVRNLAPEAAARFEAATGKTRDAAFEDFFHELALYRANG